MYNYNSSMNGNFDEANYYDLFDLSSAIHERELESFLFHAEEELLTQESVVSIEQMQNFIIDHVTLLEDREIDILIELILINSEEALRIIDFDKEPTVTYNLLFKDSTTHKNVEIVIKSVYEFILIFKQLDEINLEIESLYKNLPENINIYNPDLITSSFQDKEQVQIIKLMCNTLKSYEEKIENLLLEIKTVEPIIQSQLQSLTASEATIIYSNEITDLTNTDNENYLNQNTLLSGESSLLVSLKRGRDEFEISQSNIEPQLLIDMCKNMNEIIKKEGNASNELSIAFDNERNSFIIREPIDHRAMADAVELENTYIIPLENMQDNQVDSKLKNYLDLYIEKSECSKYIFESVCTNEIPIKEYFTSLNKDLQPVHKKFKSTENDLVNAKKLTHTETLQLQKTLAIDSDLYSKLMSSRAALLKGVQLFFASNHTDILPN